MDYPSYGVFFTADSTKENEWPNPAQIGDNDHIPNQLASMGYIDAKKFRLFKILLLNL